MLLSAENAAPVAVTDNDLVATWTGVEVHNSNHGIVARNDIWPGTHGCHGMINIYAVTFEHNRCVGAVQGSRLCTCCQPRALSVAQFRRHLPSHPTN